MKKVIIYSTPTCGFCYMAKEYFKRNSVEYEERDVTTSEDYIREMVAKSGQMGVPVIDINGDIVVGFNQPALASKLGIK